MNTFVLIENGKVVGTTAFENLEGYKVLPAPKNWDGNIEKLKYKNGQLTLIPEEEYIELKRKKLIEERIKELNEATDTYFYKEAAERGDYKNMGEIVYDAQQGDEDAGFLLRLYDAIWEKEEELENQVKEMSLSELQQLNISNFIKTVYDPIKDQLNQTQRGE